MTKYLILAVTPVSIGVLLHEATMAIALTLAAGRQSTWMWTFILAMMIATMVVDTMTISTTGGTTMVTDGHMDTLMPRHPKTRLS